MSAMLAAVHGAYKPSIVLSRNYLGDIATRRSKVLLMFCCY
uniref:Uncharacterized protein n=1 Tax=Arundo donax TaxID=35708 RepID=A0A0A9F7J5_ARUDO